MAVSNINLMVTSGPLTRLKKTITHIDDFEAMDYILHGQPLLSDMKCWIHCSQASSQIFGMGNFCVENIVYHKQI